MPFLQNNPRFKGISLPPSGWALAILLSLYIFTGLIGHDPWKHDDAITIGVAFDMASQGHWLLPQLAGQPYPDAPFYYWIAAGFAKLFSWLLPAHDAIRLASGLFTLLALEFILLAARELHGKEFAATGPLVLAGSLGFLFHAHEAQPMLAALTAHTAAYWALILLPRQPRLATPVLGAALGIAFLANGLLPVLALIPAILLTLLLSEQRLTDALRLASSLALALALCALWLLPAHLAAPDYLADFWLNELSGLAKPLAALHNLARYLNLLLWYAWPAMPLAAWALWARRRQLGQRPIALPALAFIATLGLLAAFVETSSAPALLLLPPLVLLAVPGVGTLRRGAANAFDWFGMVTFTFFAAVVWVAWCAMVFGWPERLARQVVRIEPGFVGHFGLVAAAFAALITLAWLWLIVTTPRSPMRGTMHWMCGVSLFWMLLAALWMPWIDYGKTYRPVSASLAKALPKNVDCIANVNLPNATLAILNYFDGITTVPQDSDASRHCHLLLMQGDPKDARALQTAGWHPIWLGHRPSDRHASDKLHLYRRQSRATSADALGDIAISDSQDNAARR
ncbi:glycosyltransferase family 39 protein [Propionivibrio dicarboxylicus]|uniref:4-amino-4-deoxy-L-arabinose transferase n=1 Tax=Propionivibrio dicarboxylicus TaxID=83767 RepID=A0A1G7ZKT7_9RHOO|nr:glycosyltransferase family 39 protein [Propionivibrio dicarboxylicus]SDH09197.1 4-amino-4-deoxy-L-arabinose transferase [Propionivibrio dicarboxylicus]